MMTSVAIIGAGMAGLTLARYLSNDYSVTLFEKSAAPGGRMASRDGSGVTFDHGAQFFTARSPQFRDFLTELIEAGVVADWHADFVEMQAGQITARRRWTEEFPHYVGVPQMAAIGHYMAQGLNIHYQTRISQLNAQDKAWVLSDDQGRAFGPFDRVIVTLPSVQTAQLLPAAFSHHAAISQIPMKPCYALMLNLKQDPLLPFQAALVKQADISWISVNNSKPQRDGFALLAHSTNKWAREHLDTNAEQVKQMMLTHVLAVTGLSTDLIASADIKRWHYANLPKQAPPGFYYDSDLKLAACGDWCIKGRVEAAFTSARLLAEHFNNA